MPTIKQYEAPDNLSLRPSEIGVTATAAAARRVVSAYHEAATSTEEAGRRIGGALASTGDTITRFVAHQEISQGAAAAAGLTQKNTQLWNDISKNADPNDPTVANKFLQETLEPQLEKFRSGFLTEGGQQFAERYAASFRQHMFEKTAADMSTKAGQAAVINQHRTINGLSNTVYNDPSSLDFALSTLEGATKGVIGSSPNLSSADAGKVESQILQTGREAIVRAAAMGYIDKAKKVPPWLSDPKYAPYVNGAEIKQFEKAAQAQQRFDRAETRAEEHDREQALRKNINKSLSDLDFAVDSNGQPIPRQEAVARLRQIVKDNPEGAALERDKIHATLKGLEREIAGAETPTRISQQNAHEFMKQIRGTDPNLQEIETKVYDSYANGGLNRADRDDLLKQIVDRKTPQGAALAQDRNEFFKRYGPSIDGGMDFGGHSALGSQRLYEAEMDARRQEAFVKSKGGDPHSVYDPRSPNFFGKPENIARFHVSMQQAMDYQKSVEKKEAPAPAAAATPPTARPAGIPDDAAIAPDGNWYVVRNGRYFRVNLKVEAKPQVPMSR